MAKLDITNLTGEALFAALKSPQKITVKKTKKPKVPEVQPYKSLGWDIESLILPVFYKHCDGCGLTHITPNRDILIKRVHKKYGTHYAPLTIVSKEPATIFSGVGMETKEEHEHIPFCQECWNLKSVIEEHHHGQEESSEALPQTEAVDEDIPTPVAGDHPLD